MKQFLDEVKHPVVLPISVEEEFFFNNQLFQISNIKDNYSCLTNDLFQEIIPSEEGEEIINYTLCDLVSDNPIFSKQKLKDKDQIRVMFYETNEFNLIKIKIGKIVYDLKNNNNENEFATNSIPVNRFIILEYREDKIQVEHKKIVQKEDGSGGFIPVEEIEIEEHEEVFFRIKYIENINTNTLENNYNTYYRTIISSVKDFEKKYSRNIMDTEYKFYIDDIFKGDIVLPVYDVRQIEKISYLTEVKVGVSEETNEDIYEIQEIDIDPKYFEVYKYGDYDEQRIISVSQDLKEPENIAQDIEIPYVITFKSGFENNVFPADLKLAFMNDVQFKMTNRGSEILTVANKTATTTDFVKNVFKNYRYMKIF